MWEHSCSHPSSKRTLSLECGSQSRVGENNRFFHYVLSMAMPNMKLIGEFVTQLEKLQAFWAFLSKMATRGHFVFPIDAKNHTVLVIWGLNGYGKCEFDWFICDKVMACTSVGVRRRRRRRRNQKHNTPEIFKFRGYNYYNIWDN